MGNLRLEHSNLEAKVNIEFTNLLENIKESVVFEEYEEDAVDVYFESSGNVVSVFVCEILKSGEIKVKEVEDETEHTISIWELNSVLDKINLVEILEAKLKF